jgi:hypothetical protein
LKIRPCVPAHWRDFKIHYRYRQTVYHLTLIQIPYNGLETDAAAIQGNGQPLIGETIELVDDHQEHHLEIRFNSRPPIEEPDSAEPIPHERPPAVERGVISPTAESSHDQVGTFP